jgi:hypothetical protein
MMNSIQLDDKKMDEAFLQGDVVVCNVVIPNSEHPEKMKPESRIVVLLSNKKKYMATIHNFIYKIEGRYARGKLELKKL